MPTQSRVIARLVPGSTAFNTLALPPPVPVHFHKSPDFPSAARGIAGLDFEVEAQGAVIAGTTGADGKIDVRVPPGGSAKIRILVAGATVSEYDVTIDLNPLTSMNSADAVLDPGNPNKVQAVNEADNGTAIRGTQERLRMLGYQIGHGGDGTGVTGVMTTEWERSVLDFQVDQDLLPDAKVDQPTKTSLIGRAGG